jgi:hypothetical protein
MASKTVLRKLIQDNKSQEARQEQARADIRKVKESVFEDRKSQELEREFPESEGLLTKQHLRHARRVAAAGKKIGATIDRLPIYRGSKPYHQEGARDPNLVQFEATLLVLIERYGPEHADEHFSLGQYQKYQKVVTATEIEFWNMRTRFREYPEMSSKEVLKLHFDLLYEGEEE